MTVFIVALIKRWWHCLIHFHRQLDAWDSYNCKVFVGCGSCDRVFWKRARRNDGD